MVTLGLQQPDRIAKRSHRSQTKLDHFLSLCGEVAEFIEANGGNLKAYLSHREGRALRLYLMTDADAFDFALSGKLSEFAAPYIDRGLLEGVMLVPRSTAEELSAYFDPKSAFRVEIDHA